MSFSFFALFFSSFDFKSNNNNWKLPKKAQNHHRHISDLVKYIYIYLINAQLQFIKQFIFVVFSSHDLVILI